MNGMRSLRWVGQLVYKDFYVLRGSVLYMTVLSLIFSALTTRLDQPWLFLGMWTGMISYFFAVSNCVFEDRADGWTFLRTLPVSAGTVMIAKYVGNLLFALGGAALLTAVGSGMAGLGWLPAPAVPVYYYTLLPMPLIWAVGGLTMWMTVRWDFRRAQMAMYGIMIAIMVLPGVGQQMMLQRPRWMAQWAEGTLPLQLTPGAWAATAVLLALYALFGLLGARAFARRDL